MWLWLHDNTSFWTNPFLLKLSDASCWRPEFPFHTNSELLSLKPDVVKVQDEVHCGACQSETDTCSKWLFLALFRWSVLRPRHDTLSALMSWIHKCCLTLGPIGTPAHIVCCSLFQIKIQSLILFSFCFNVYMHLNGIRNWKSANS